MRGNAKLFSGAARPTDVQGCSSPFRAGDGLRSALPGVDKAGQTGKGRQDGRFAAIRSEK